MILELPCGIGDTIYYVTEWDKYSFQANHITKVESIYILKNEIVINTKYRNFLMTGYKKTWFTDKEKWLEECEVLRETHRFEQQLRKSKGE